MIFTHFRNFFTPFTHFHTFHTIFIHFTRFSLISLDSHKLLTFIFTHYSTKLWIALKLAMKFALFAPISVAWFAQWQVSRPFFSFFTLSVTKSAKISDEICAICCFWHAHSMASWTIFPHFLLNLISHLFRLMWLLSNLNSVDFPERRSPPLQNRIAQIWPPLSGERTPAGLICALWLADFLRKCL